jgi:hypothetical protein
MLNTASTLQLREAAAMCGRGRCTKSQAVTTRRRLLDGTQLYDVNRSVVFCGEKEGICAPPPVAVTAEVQSGTSATVGSCRNRLLLIFKPCSALMLQDLNKMDFLGPRDFGIYLTSSLAYPLYLWSGRSDGDQAAPTFQHLVDLQDRQSRQSASPMPQVARLGLVDRQASPWLQDLPPLGLEDLQSSAKASVAD